MFCALFYKEFNIENKLIMEDGIREHSVKFLKNHMGESADKIENGKPGTVLLTQIDYILVSRPLYDSIRDVKIERRGLYSSTNFNGSYPSFPQVTGTATQASDNAAICATFDI